MKLPRATKQLRKSLKTWGCWLYGSCSLIVWLTALSLGKKQQCWRPPAGHAEGAAWATRRLSSLKHMDLVQERRGREAEARYLFSICGCRKGGSLLPLCFSCMSVGASLAVSAQLVVITHCSFRGSCWLWGACSAWLQTHCFYGYNGGGESKSSGTERRGGREPNNLLLEPLPCWIITYL